jgi:hypothetical protein
LLIAGPVASSGASSAASAIPEHTNKQPSKSANRIGIIPPAFKQ